ncbi:hypothetical protein Tco_0122012 [Tanacetum coccineum]
MLVQDYYEHIPPTGLGLVLLGVHTLELEDGTTIHMLAERRYPLSRELMIRMLDHGMEVEDESETAITLIHLFILWTTEDVEGDDARAQCGVYKEIWGSGAYSQEPDWVEGLLTRMSTRAGLASIRAVRLPLRTRAKRKFSFGAGQRGMITRSVFRDVDALESHTKGGAVGGGLKGSGMTRKDRRDEGRGGRHPGKVVVRVDSVRCLESLDWHVLKDE